MSFTFSQALRHPIRPMFKIVLVAITCAVPTACGSSTDDADVVYVALGASDATGIGASPLDEGYVFEIQEGIEMSGRSTALINLGIPGAEADDIEDIELAIAAEVDEANLYTLFTGGNDLVNGRRAESFEEDLQNILEEIRDESEAQIFVANLPDLTQLPRFRDEPDPDVTPERVAAFNAAIARQTAAANAVLVDLFAVPVEDFLVSDDGFHPNDEGHERIAQLFLDQILPRLPQ